VIYSISWSKFNLVVCQETKMVSQLSTEAEYKAMTDATAELMWVQSVLQEL
jgi:hypothetical protein